MLRGEPLRYFMDEVQPHASAAADAFVMVQAKYMSSAHRDRYIHEWNALSFRSFVKPGISSAQALDELFARARDLQAMLKAPYDSDLLLRDTITRAVQDESFYGLLSATDIPADSGILHTRLQKCIQVSRSAVRNTSSNVVTQSGNDSTYFAVDPDENSDDQWELFYGQNGSPFFKRRNLRAPWSFSPYRSWSRGGGNQFHGRDQRYSPGSRYRSRPPVSARSWTAKESYRQDGECATL